MGLKKSTRIFFFAPSIINPVINRFCEVGEQSLVLMSSNEGKSLMKAARLFITLNGKLPLFSTVRLMLNIILPACEGVLATLCTKTEGSDRKYNAASRGI